MLSKVNSSQSTPPKNGKENTFKINCLFFHANLTAGNEKNFMRFYYSLIVKRCISCWISKEDIENSKFSSKFYDEFDKRCVNLSLYASPGWGWSNVSNSHLQAYYCAWMIGSLCQNSTIGPGLIMKISTSHGKYLL